MTRSVYIRHIPASVPAEDIVEVSEQRLSSRWRLGGLANALEAGGGCALCCIAISTCTLKKYNFDYIPWQHFLKDWLLQIRIISLLKW